MANYKELYLEMMRATEKAIRILVEAQQQCEEAFLADDEPRVYLLPKKEEQEHL